ILPSAVSAPEDSMSISARSRISCSSASLGWLATSRPLFHVELFEPLGPRRVAQAAQRLCLDLADALAGDAELLAHLLERHRPAVVEPEAEPDDLVLALGQRGQYLADLLLQDRARGGLLRRDGISILHEIAQARVRVVRPQRRLQR